VLLGPCAACSSPNAVPSLLFCRSPPVHALARLPVLALRGGLDLPGGADDLVLSRTREGSDAGGPPLSFSGDRDRQMRDPDRASDTGLQQRRVRKSQKSAASSRNEQRAHQKIFCRINVRREARGHATI
jgi:hypothetical protein